ncbi:MAG: Panacea domain-containing protein [Puia sp.]|nr:Panacea domain-containing protein [Puia sp.]
MTTLPVFKRTTFKSLVQYVCSRCQDNPSRLGATKLNKVLWYVDTGHFLKTGKSLTGARYVKRQHGPVPAAIPAIIDELVAERKLHVRDVQFYEYDKKEYITLEEPDDIDSIFSASDIRDIDRIIDSVCDTHTAKSISLKTHNEPWQMAEIGEDLPIFTVLARTGELTEADMVWADEKIARMQ